MIRYLVIIILVILMDSCSSEMPKSKIEIEPKFNIIGEYSSSDSLSKYNSSSVSKCNLKLRIEKVNQSYFYHFESNSRKKSGILTLEKDTNNQWQYISLKSFEWADYTGPLDDELNPILENPDIPQNISGVIENDELVFQNSGNRMNYYTKVSECGTKYFRFRKVKN